MIGVRQESGGLAPLATMTTTATTETPMSNGGTGAANTSRTTRDRAQNAVDYYNSNVLKARIGAGLAATRNTIHERHNFQGRYLNSTGHRLYPPNSENLYRSNSSLELLHDNGPGNGDSLAYASGNLRREYGSHGSIDVISSDRGCSQSTGEKFFAMLEDYQPAVLEGLSRSTTQVPKTPVPNSVQRHSHPHAQVQQQNGTVEDIVDRGNASPKLRTKLHRLWGPAKTTIRSSQPNSMDESVNLSNAAGVTATTTTVSSADIEERQRRRAFAHYDCQSLTANLGYAAKLRGLLLARRRNTTTGASAAATYSTRSSTPDGDSADEDYGDGVSNDLLESCPFFRNETGGEEEREVSLSRMQNHVPPGQNQPNNRRAIHRPSLAYGVALLECAADESLWKQITCPFQKGPRPIEQVDNGARYYRNYFLGQEHQNWFGMDEQLGPVAISIKKEKLPASSTNLYPPDVHLAQVQQHLFRLIVRTSELLTLRGSVVEESIPNPRGSGKQVTTKEVLEYVAPEVQIQCLRLGVNTPQCEQQLLKLDEQGLTNKYKVGVLYCRAGQSSEEEMYNNEEAGPAFLEFLETIGKRVRLKGFENYKAGLDNKTDSTGTHSIHANYQDSEIMFHVSTMLPYTPNNRQQLLRKRHIGNDIVCVVFQEPGALPFTPKNIRSQFQHVFIIVRVVNPCTENTHYRIAVSRSKEVPVFGPPVRAGSLYPKGKTFADFLLSKIINAENAAHRSEKFATMATRTRQEYLKDLTTNYCTATVVDTGQKFSIFPSKKKERTKPRFSGDLIQRGAFCWQVVLHDAGLSSQVDCFLGISAETFVLIEECTRQIIFVTACKSILGWSTSGNSLRVYHHQGECVTLNMRDSGDRDEQLEVIERLRAVTKGCGALELSLRRNPMGQLGFHVQPDGVVTQVEVSGQAWTSGLRQGYRLVEICKVAVSTLSHDQMVDLLKTSAQVTVTVIESFADYSPRRGCYLQNCKFNAINYESDYEQIDRNGQHQEKGGNGGKKSSTVPQHQQPSIVNHRRRYERNFSPPRSSNSSGYGTGSSSRSFQTPNTVHETRYIPEMGTLTSSSSGHSSNDDRWYDVLEPPTNDTEGHTNGQPIYQQHQKLQPSHSLPLSSVATNRTLSIHDPNSRPRGANMEYMGGRLPKIKDYADSDALLKNLHITETNNNNVTGVAMVESLYSTTKKIAPICPTDDEDLLSEMTSHTEPHSIALKRSATTNNIYGSKKNGGGTVSSSASSSRNNSPRPLTEAKLRAGINNRSTNYQQRNSVNYTGSSSLMEDLKKLIDLDYTTASDDNFHNGSLTKPQKNIPNSHSLGNISSLSSFTPALQTEDLILMKNKSRSREGINLGSGQLITKSNGHAHKNEDDGSEVIFTTARPATVVSNSSSPAKEMISGSMHMNEEKLKQSPRKQQMNLRNGGNNNNSKLPLLPDIKDMDWTTLVDTATRAMLQSQAHHDDKSASANIYEELNGIEQSLNRATPPSQLLSEAPTPHSLSPSSSQNSTNSSHSNLMGNNATMPELQNQVCHLSDRVLRETRRRKSLEHAVRRLTEENRRLQDESQQAVQQLRRFTEWLFQSNFMTK